MLEISGNSIECNVYVRLKGPLLVILLILDRNYLRTYIHKRNYCVVIKFRVLAESRLNGDPHPRTKHK